MGSTCGGVEVGSEVEVEGEVDEETIEEVEKDKVDGAAAEIQPQMRSFRYHAVGVVVES